MPPRRASDVFAECLEAEGVRHAFGIPGEETLDLNESPANSSPRSATRSWTAHADKKLGRHFGVDFTNAGFVKLAEAFGMPAWRCEAVDDFARHLGHALTRDELGTETVAT